MPVRTGYIDLHKPRFMSREDFHSDHKRFTENEAKSKKAMEKWKLARKDSDLVHDEEIQQLFSPSSSNFSKTVPVSNLGLDEKLVQNGKIEKVSELQRQVVEGRVII